jgi:hypothetical protein
VKIGTLSALSVQPIRNRSKAKIERERRARSHLIRNWRRAEGDESLHRYQDEAKDHHAVTADIVLRIGRPEVKNNAAEQKCGRARSFSLGSPF